MRIKREATTREMVVIEPAEYRGREVAIVSDDPAVSVVNPDGQFHYAANLFAADASVLPTCGSANPVMNGIALRRRLAKRLVPDQRVVYEEIADAWVKLGERANAVGVMKAYVKMFPESKESERLTWSRYRNAFFEFLARTQNADGSWNGVPIGQVYTACCYLTILQLDNGVLPIYQR